MKLESSFLYIGITFSIFSESGKTPVVSDKLQMCTRGVTILPVICFKKCVLISS